MAGGNCQTCGASLGSMIHASVMMCVSLEN